MPVSLLVGDAETLSFEMNQPKQLITWFLKAWPFMAIFIIAFFHVKFLEFFPGERAEYINKSFIAILQLIGGLIVLYTINSNLGLFEQKGLAARAFSWLKSCPLFKKPESVTINASPSLLSLSASGDYYSTNKFENINEQLEELQRQINEVRGLVNRKEKEMKVYVNKKILVLNETISTNSLEINSVKGLIHRTVVEGIQLQILGVLLVGYGAVFPILYTS